MDPMRSALYPLLTHAKLAESSSSSKCLKMKYYVCVYQLTIQYHMFVTCFNDVEYRQASVDQYSKNETNDTLLIEIRLN